MDARAVLGQAVFQGISVVRGVASLFRRAHASLASECMRIFWRPTYVMQQHTRRAIRLRLAYVGKRAGTLWLFGCC